MPTASLPIRTLPSLPVYLGVPVNLGPGKVCPLQHFGRTAPISVAARQLTIYLRAPGSCWMP